MTQQTCVPASEEPLCACAPEAALERLFGEIGEVSSLPTVALHIMQMAGDPKSRCQDLAEAIRRDPALAMRLMRTVNSSYYALKNKVADLDQAIVMLGFEEVRNLAVTAYVATLFREGAGYGPYTRTGLWRHMVGVGMVAQLVARTCKGVRPQEAYLAGLLHDVGLILLDQYDQEGFRRVLDALSDQSPAWETERKMLGFDHAGLGQFVAARWNLPEHLTMAIGHHHAAEPYEGPHREFVHLVAIADLFCHLRGLTPLGVQTRQMPPVRVFNELGLRREHLTEIQAHMDGVLKAVDMMVLLQAR